MKPSTLAVARHVFRSPARWLPVVALIGFGIAVYAGTYIGVGRIEDTTERLYQELRLFDLSYTVERTELRKLPSSNELNRQFGFESSTWRARFPGAVTLPSGETLGAVVVAVAPDDRPQVSDVLLTSGEYLAEDPTRVVVDHTFALDHQIELGDVLQVRALGHRAEVTVGGIGVFPEFLVPSIDEHVTIPVRGSLVGLMASLDLVAQQQDKNPANLFVGPTVNELLVRMPHGWAPLSSEELQQRLAPVELRDTMTRAEQYSVRAHGNRLKVFAHFLPGVVLVFESLAALVLLVSMHQLAHSWRREAGTLMAFGHRRSQLAVAWGLVVVALVAAGVLLGTLLSWPFAEAITRAYVKSSGFPLVLGPTDMQPLLEAILVALVLVPLGGSSALRVVQRRPVELLRHPVVSEPVGLTRVLRRWPFGRASALGIRNTLRRPGGTTATVLAAAGTMVMAASMYIFSHSQWTSTMDFLASRHWDGTVTFREPITEERLDDVMFDVGVEYFERFSQSPGQLIADRTVDVAVVGWPISSKLQSDGWLHKGRWVRPGADEVVISNRELRTLDLDVGDQITVAVDGRARPVKVVGVVHGLVLGQAFVSPTLLEAFEPKDLSVGALVLAEPKALNNLTQHRDVGLLVRGEVVKTATAESNAAFVRVLRLYGHLGALLTLLIALTAMRTRGRDRLGEHAVLLSFGIPPAWIGKSLVTEAAIVGLLAGAVAVPMTQIALRYYQERIAETWIYVPMQDDLLTVALVVGIPVVMLPLAALMPTLDLRRSNIARSLSARKD